ncbi:PREDICTED: uncharacterized aarF domain-containing protein kinase At5g05200, chloroplastic-like [Nelumbo nucifera]|uniref:Uncharacterized aarF domain-containing protein kinase At5g05200, chloroplastic-like n=1 Tax=Nelumbo nucifera TaxID=4432 RepID=A0A1U7ZIY4_NELNU|nr:PREDICTED: uncharacterized aarF domain-containing protein kinase At5g05200, chloroplastic-like [Nelumbo nucifera]
MAVSAFRGATYARLPLLHHSKPKLPCISISTSIRSRKLRVRSNRLALFARYAQAQDFSSRLQGRIDDLPKLVEDIVQTSINTGPRGAYRLAQGIQAVIGVGREWLVDVSKVTSIWFSLF